MVTILVATYNGEKYLEEQLESLLNQTYKSINIVISDDFSSDTTIDIIKKYLEKFPDKIKYILNEKNSGSPKYNFFKMMIEIKDDYVMLCDQDDVWLPNKVENTLSKMKALENKYGKITPMLVHTDLCVVDENLNVINQSFKEAMNANYDRTKFNQMLIQNTLTGCTAMYNRALADLILEEPDYCVMHDWWIMLIASAFGKISHIDDQTILYRQHHNNEIGASDVRTLKYKINRLLDYKNVKEALNNTYIQAKSFLEIYHDKLTNDQINLLEKYCDIPNMNKFNRWRTIIKLGVLKHGITRKIANLIFI